MKTRAKFDRIEDAIADVRKGRMIVVVDDPDRAAVRRLLRLDSLVDLVIPRGGPDLTRSVREESLIPVLAHDKGLCHTYVDAKADLGMAVRVALNAKAERPSLTRQP